MFSKRQGFESSLGLIQTSTHNRMDKYIGMHLAVKYYTPVKKGKTENRRTPRLRVKKSYGAVMEANTVVPGR